MKKQQEDLLRNQWEIEKMEEQRQLMEKERQKQELGLVQLFLCSINSAETFFRIR